jgi:major membrane immunogen (membrane-anchored lipoprotein)
MKNTLILFLFVYLVSCGQSDYKSEEVLATTPYLVPAIDTVEAKQSFSHQDSIEYLAIDGYYFGKMRTEYENKIPEIVGVKFTSIMYSECCYEFLHKTGEDITQSAKSKIEKLVSVFNYKYGSAKKTDLRNEDSGCNKIVLPNLSKRVKTESFIWNNQFKKIILSTIEEDNEIIYITLKIINLKLEKENKEKKKKALINRNDNI